MFTYLKKTYFKKALGIQQLPLPMAEIFKVTRKDWDQICRDTQVSENADIDADQQELGCWCLWKMPVDSYLHVYKSLKKYYPVATNFNLGVNSLALFEDLQVLIKTVLRDCDVQFLLKNN